MSAKYSKNRPPPPCPHWTIPFRPSCERPLWMTSIGKCWVEICSGYGQRTAAQMVWTYRCEYKRVDDRVSRTYRRHQHKIIGHLETSFFQSIACTGTDNLTRTTKRIRNTKKSKTSGAGGRHHMSRRNRRIPRCKLTQIRHICMTQIRPRDVTSLSYI